MTKTLSIAMAQLNPTVGAVADNIAKVIAARESARALGADLLVSAELVVCGYPPEDLVRKPAFSDLVGEKIAELAAQTADGGPAVLLGTSWQVDGKLYNSALLLDGGEIAAVRHKHHLPNYGVFDEKRVFDQAPLPEPIHFRGVSLGVMVCEDMWFEDVGGHLKNRGAEVLVVLNGSPFDYEKPSRRLDLARARVQQAGVGLIYVNQVGGQDELVFDGASFVLNKDGLLRGQCAAWQEEVALTRWQYDEQNKLVCVDAPQAPPSRGMEAIYQAMVVGLRDYVTKNGFPGVVLGLSGGIDSAISAAVAVDALGADRVLCVMMPSPYTSEESLDDAARVASLLGVRCETVAIDPVMGAYQAMLAPLFAGRNADLTEENIQSRARGLLLMALSNKFGHMLLTTGNKSEMSVGYATIYGDMCGGYSVLKDIYKMTVFALCRWRNENFPENALGPKGAVMPERVITKPPSAELRPDQKDQDSLPPYDVLDDILHSMIEGEMSVEQIVARGHEKEIVRRVWRLLDRAEYKRRQAPPGVKISSRAFGRDRRYPITNGFTSLI